MTLYEAEYDEDEPSGGDYRRAVETILNHPMAQTIFAHIGQAIDKAGRPVSRPEDSEYYQGPGRAYSSEWPPRPPDMGPPPGSQAPRPSQTGEDPRSVLGFSPTERLTAQSIKQRKRALAEALHPDRPGGSEEAMRRVNAAADALLAQIR